MPQRLISVNFKKYHMKSFLKLSVVLLLPGFLFAGCGKQDRFANNQLINEWSMTAVQQQISTLPVDSLSTEEINSLMKMREEEKLARDVYKTLYVKWGSRVFSNISTAEQNHMDAVLMLIKKYNLYDPVPSDEIGVFKSDDMTKLYKQLTELGNKSLLDAFKVGATIEDLDLFDLMKAFSFIVNEDIRLVYSNLSRGSRNHLRAFYRNIQNTGGDYTPQYLTVSEFNAVISSDMERGGWQ